ncbi:MAG TPA: protease pro-enzyme activation domain-containing protein, partial [Acidobacteriaceae bacterium]|nr:protease pro-enzyme activation domain-containing protein [Acidobacteriaceae bacterium]
MRLRSLAHYACIFCLAGPALAQTAHSRPEVLGAADASASTHFSVFLPLTNQAAMNQLMLDQVDPTSPSYHKWLTPSQFKAQFGPKAADMAKAKRALEAAGLTVTAEHTQSLEVSGPVSAVEHLFSTRLQQVQLEKGSLKFAAQDHKLTLPAELASVGAVVPAFNPSLMAHVHSHRLTTAGAVGPLAAGGGSVNQRLSSADSWFYPDDMNEAYDFPSFTTSIAPGGTGPAKQVVGLGATIGIVISSAISQADINDAFNSTVTAGSAQSVQSYSTQTSLPVPVVTIETVDGGSGAFNKNADAAGEASLDTQMSLGTAPGAKEILYDIPDLTDQSIVDAYTQVNEDNKVDVVSSSFGECELDYTAAANGGTDYTYILQTFHSLFAQGNMQGITFLASSGDNG